MSALEYSEPERGKQQNRKKAGGQQGRGVRLRKLIELTPDHVVTAMKVSEVACNIAAAITFRPPRRGR